MAKDDTYHEDRKAMNALYPLFPFDDYDTNKFIDRWWGVIVFSGLFLVFSLIMGLACLLLKLLS